MKDLLLAIRREFLTPDGQEQILHADSPSPVQK